MKDLFFIKNNDDKYIFVKTFILSILLNLSLYIYIPYVMDIFYNLNNHYSPVFEYNGRYIRNILDNIISYLFNPFLVPYFSLFISSLIFSYSLLCLYKFLIIKNDYFKKIFPYSIILPCFTLLNIFYHDLPYYSFNFLIMILSAIIISNDKFKFKYLLFIFMSILTLFIYQINFFFVSSLLLFDIIRDLLNNNNIKKVLIKTIKYFICILSSLLLYFISFKIFNLNLNSRGADLSLFNLFKTYAAFIILPFKDYMQINELLFSKVSIFIIYLIIVYLIFRILLNNNYNMKTKILLFVMFLIFPISMNSILLVLKNPSRGMYAELYILIIPFFLIEYSNLNFCQIKIINYLLCISLIIILLSNSYTANARYLELKNRSDAEKSWTIELVSSIRQTEGYNIKCKIAFITKTKGNIDSNNLLDFYEDYNHNRFGSEYASSILRFNYGEGLDLALKYYGAFQYNKATKEEIELIKNKEEYKNMPIYPNYGSIKNIDNILVVKFY